MTTIFDSVISNGLPTNDTLLRADARPERPDPVDTREALTRVTTVAINPETDGAVVPNAADINAEIRIPAGTENVAIYVTTDDVGGVSSFEVFGRYEQGTELATNFTLKDYTNPTMDTANFVSIVGSTDSLPYLYIQYTNASGGNAQIGVWVTFTTNS